MGRTRVLSVTTAALLLLGPTAQPSSLALDGGSDDATASSQASEDSGILDMPDVEDAGPTFGVDPTAPDVPLPKPSEGSFAPAPPTTPGYGVGPIARGRKSGKIRAWRCEFEQAIDALRMSGDDVSAHASWISLSGDCPAKADVSGVLEAYFCYKSGTCVWVPVKKVTRRTGPGSGSGRRVAVRCTACARRKPVGWRVYVDVDIPGRIDPPNITRVGPINLPCSPS